MQHEFKALMDDLLASPFRRRRVSEEHQDSAIWCGFAACQPNGTSSSSTHLHTFQLWFCQVLFRGASLGRAMSQW